MNLNDDDFSLFGLPRRFAQDRSTIDSRWRELQAQVHPDRFASQGTAAQRIAMQWAVRVNEAYKRLKDPLQRAAYLCELNDVQVRVEDNTAMPAAFLEQQMSWRESLDAAGALADIQALASQVDAHHAQALVKLQATIDDRHDFAAAAGQVRALMFVERFAGDVDARLEALGH